MNPLEIEGYIKVREGNVRIVRSVPDSLKEACDESYADKSFKHPYYQLIQKCLGDQFDQYFLILERDGGRSYVQPLFLVRQSILGGLPALLKTGLGGLMQRWIPSMCEIKILMLGCCTGEGTLAGTNPDHPGVASILHESLPEVARRMGSSLIVLKDFPQKYRTALNYFAANGYARIPSFPACKARLPYQDFEDYMVRGLTYQTRKNLRRKFRDAENLGGFSMELVDDFTPILDDIYPLYRQVIDRSKFKFEELTKEYFAGLAESLGGRGRFFIWRDSCGKIVAFTLCVIDGKTLRDCYIGLDYEIALKAHLYFITFRDVFSWAAKNGMEEYYSSPLNYSPKLHLKLELAPLDLYIRHTSSVINFFFQRLIPVLEPTQYDPVLREFPNFSDLR